MFDVNGDGQLSYEEIVAAIVKFSEDITSLDFQRLGLAMQNIRDHADAVEQRLAKLSKDIEQLQSVFETLFTRTRQFKETAIDTKIREMALVQLRKNIAPEAARLR